MLVVFHVALLTALPSVAGQITVNFMLGNTSVFDLQ